MTSLEVYRYYASDSHNGFAVRFNYNSEYYDLNIGASNNCTYKMRLVYFDTDGKYSVLWSIN